MRPKTLMLSTGMEGFWAVLSQSRTIQALVPYERWDVEQLYSSEQQPSKSYARFGAFVTVRPTLISCSFNFIEIPVCGYS